MDENVVERAPRGAGILFLTVLFLVLLQVGALISNVLADTGGGAIGTTVLPEDASDIVAATAAEFRVDESGAATYTIPLYAVPGTAGVSPKLSLNYSSQGGYGPIGKGWSIGGLSSVTRCRKTREAGDFISGGVVTDGSPNPVNFTDTDAYCLDGQRLIQVTSASVCPTLPGLIVTSFRTEIESFQRVCGYSPGSPYTGFAFFTVNRKDGSTSWYGDRDNNSTRNRADGYFNSTRSDKADFALAWAQTRFQDSTGNYIDYIYSENPGGTGTGEQVLSEVRYTGKTVLNGQTGSAKAPYAKLKFNYSARPTTQWGKGYASGGMLTQSRRLDSVTVCTIGGTANCDPSTQQARYYQLTYAASSAGSGLDTLSSFQECTNSDKTVCLPETTFGWSAGNYGFATNESPSNWPTGSLSKFEGFKMGDVDGDGRQDVVYLKDGSSGEYCSTEYVYVLFATQDATGALSYLQGSPICTPAEDGGIEGSWELVDYNGDGRDDLFIRGTSQWYLYPSQGRSGNWNFDSGTNLIASLSPAIPSQSASNEQVQLVDFNGDGLADIVYPTLSGMKTRLMERDGSGSFGWGAERRLFVDTSNIPAFLDKCTQTNYDCLIGLNGLTTKAGQVQLADLNGDAASDLIAEIFNLATYTGGGCTPQLQASRRNGTPALGACPPDVTKIHTYALTVAALASDSVTLKGYYDFGAQVSTVNLADVNGDGLTDVFWRPTDSSEWQYNVNTGIGMLSPVQVPLDGYEDQVRFADVNGDGRTDILHVANTGSYKAYKALQALPGGGFGAEAWLPSGGNARICEGPECDNDKKVPIFTDLDGDGNLDFMSIKMDDNADVYISRPNYRYLPRDVITGITNGLGATTTLTYAALTNNAVYLRDTGSRNSIDAGRGAAVTDLLMPSYVVARAASSAPSDGNPNGVAKLFYRYAGAKMQAGGRGFLGFREIVTIDPNEAEGYVTTQTIYNQKFPLVGMPARTIKRAVTSGTYVIPACLTQTISDTCFYTYGATTFPTPAGNWFSDNTQYWEADTDLASVGLTDFAATVQAPIHVRTSGTDELLRDPYSGATTSKVSTTFTYEAYGNVDTTVVDTYTGTSTSATATTTTENTYSDTPSAWFLARLQYSTVRHSRPGQTDVVRTTAFAYDATTGQLLRERSQYGETVNPANVDLKRVYVLDEYGNRTLESACSIDVTTCGDTTGVVFQPSSLTTVNRFTRTAYDSIGRYPKTTVAPFWNGGTGSGVVEKTTQTVVSRNMFGDVTQAFDVNGVDTVAVTGGFGRPYYTWTETVPGSTPGDPMSGVRTYTKYRNCGDVGCPTGARFRQEQKADSAPTVWTYFDLLGRPVMKVSETFNIDDPDKDLSAVCTTYTPTGKTARISNPFFLPGVAGGNGPIGLASACNATGVLWSSTTYDVLGRPIQIQSPDINGGTATVGIAYSGRTTTTIDPRTNATIKTVNGLGELISVTDAAGLVTTYGYLADGSNSSVSRNAGRGAVLNTFQFDVLGRKILQNDPDTGTTQFGYNALGELIWQQHEGDARIENLIDARGRVWKRTALVPDGAVESTATFTYDTTTNGLGQLAFETITGTYTGWTPGPGNNLAFSRTYTYDSLGRPSGTTTGLDNSTFDTAVTYDTYGRPTKVMDASGRWSKTHYNDRGMADVVCKSTAADAGLNCDPSNSVFTTLETDAWGHAVWERRGNTAAMDVVRTYSPETGRIATICAGARDSHGDCKLFDAGYNWDQAGNLITQAMSNGNRYAETYAYDGLNRLKEARLLVQDGLPVSTVTQSFEYDALGNVCRRSGSMLQTAEFTYLGRSGCGLGDDKNSAYGNGSANTYGAHQLVQSDSGGTTVYYGYDPSGNQITKDAPSATYDRTIKYSLDNHAYEAAPGSGTTVKFWYGSDGARYKRIDGSKKTLYLGNVEIVIEGGVNTFRRTLAGEYLQTIVSNVATENYLFHDQLGNLVRITNATGTPVNNLDYAAFGGRRDWDTQASGGQVPTLTTRGFTGQEHIDGNLGLMHFNARLYDPAQGRFIQPDPVIQAPDNAQSWNAYSYAFNNPLTYTDPTGMIGTTERMWAAAIVAIVAAVWTGGASIGWFATLTSTQVFAITVSAAFLSGAIATQSFKGGLLSAFGAALTFGIASWVPQNYQVFAQAMAGGISESLQGGNFGNGFIAAGLTAAVMPHLGNVASNRGGRIMLGALIGGTISEVTGGKFANGAISGAIQGAMAGQEDALQSRESPETLSFADAPEALRSQLLDPDSWTGAVQTIATNLGYGNVADRMVAVNDDFRNKLGRPDPSVSAITVAGKTTYFRSAFTHGYYGLSSIIDHEVVHLYSYIKFGPSYGAREKGHREFAAYKYQASRENFWKASDYFRRGQLGGWQQEIDNFRDALHVWNNGCGSEALACQEF
ncbi:FG-GAP-like repeat-containing protein [Pseudoluteimonas lycopersici]|uniref:FG-GAP-like repeat-containing protein n=1 Tax=Pseudoluteimonas lycopersici TaxID=1324796 RepID=UPI00163D9D88|nr:FG-GAP-like repeat-containing protein [Lysobacter lycopersici]